MKKLTGNFGIFHSKHVNLDDIKLGDIFGYKVYTGRTDYISYLGRGCLSSECLTQLCNTFILEIEGACGKYNSITTNISYYNESVFSQREYFIFSSVLSINDVLSNLKDFLSNPVYRMVLIDCNEVDKYLSHASFKKSVKVDVRNGFSEINKEYYKQLYGIDYLPDEVIFLKRKLTGANDFPVLLRE